MNEINLVIFDLDNTLVDTDIMHFQALNQALLDFGFPIISKEHHDTIYKAMPTKSKLNLLKIPDDFKESLSALKQKYTQAMIPKHVYKNQEIIDLLTALSGRGIFLACVTNSVRETTDLMLQYAGLTDLFDVVVTNEDVKNPKPNSEGFIQAMISTFTFPDETVIVEDSDKGLIAARNTGARVIQVNNPSEVNFSLLNIITKGE